MVGSPCEGGIYHSDTPIFILFFNQKSSWKEEHEEEGLLGYVPSAQAHVL